MRGILQMQRQVEEAFKICTPRNKTNRKKEHTHKVRYKTNNNVQQIYKCTKETSQLHVAISYRYILRGRNAKADGFRNMNVLQWLPENTEITSSK